MQRLNIPLHRYQHTTRLPRRVVSLFAFLLAGAGIGIVGVGMLWYGRDTTSASAPQDTAIVLHFHPSRFKWDATERALGDIPLVSNRSLTVSDILGFANGEFSVFIGNDGSRSVAVRSSKGRLPTDELDALGILAEETSRGVFLLSDRPVARMEWKPAHVWFGSVHWPGAWRIGNIHMVEDRDVRGPIYASGEKTRIRLPKQGLTTIPWKTLPTDTILALAMPALPNTSVVGVTESIDAILSSYDTPTASAIADHVLSSSGAILLKKSTNRLGFLITTDLENFAKELQQKIIQAAAALQSPRIQPLTLPDNSIAQEMIVDPSLTTVEETTVAGILVSRVATMEGDYLYTAESDDSFVITNEQDLLEYRLTDGEDGEKQACGGNVLFLNLREFLAASSDALTARTTNELVMLNGEYFAVAVDQGWFYTHIRFCH